MTEQHIAYIGIGTNIEPRNDRMQSAMDALANRWTVVAKSSIYETTPVGFAAQPNFLNAVIAISTNELPHDLHHRLKALEHELGRQQRERWHEREIDFDILFYHDRIIDEDGLIIPHPEMHKRLFVLFPLVEIAPEFVHPLLEQNMQSLLALLNVADQKIEKVFA